MQSRARARTPAGDESSSHADFWPSADWRRWRWKKKCNFPPALFPELQFKTVPSCGSRFTLRAERFDCKEAAAHAADWQFRSKRISYFLQQTTPALSSGPVLWVLDAWTLPTRWKAARRQPVLRVCGAGSLGEHFSFWLLHTCWFRFTAD